MQECSVISKWGTPKTPAPSGPLTLYVGPSRDAGRLRARRDRHRAAAPALSERRRTFQTDSLSRPGPGARGGSRFRGLRWTALLESGRPSSAVCKCVVSLSPVDGDVPSSGGHVDRLLGQPRRPHSPVPPTLLTLAADLPPLSRSSSLSLDPRQGHLPQVPEPPASAAPSQPKSSPAGSQRLRNWGRVGKLQSIAL